MGILTQTAFCAAQNHVVVIDAGHGGKDPGAVSGSHYEKNINHNIALKTAKIIKAKMPNAKILFTRTTDKYIPLQERTSFANRNKASIFISIHTNANSSSSASGIETYIMGGHKTGANLSVAMKENSVITLEDNYEQTYQGYDPSSSESFIIFSLMQYAYQEQSLQLAHLVQEEYAANTPLKNRGVKQAGFLVLWRSTMPAILTEVGFISNPNDKKFITSESGQTKIAQSIANATAKFLKTQTIEKPITITTPKTNGKTTGKTYANETYYAVQLKASKKQLAINSSNFGQWVVKVNEHKMDFLCKYTVGNFASYKEALTLQNVLRQQFKGCFIVAYKNKRQISLQEAKQILE